MLGAEGNCREQLLGFDLGVLGNAERPRGVRVGGRLLLDELLGAPAIAANPMEPKGRGLRVERCTLFLVEGELDDPATPEPNVDSEQLIELVRELSVKLSTPPTELKRQGVLE
jgi:hypothetical protein